jgi:hypothetical protein
VLFSADFWPLFWTILGSGALLTVALCFVVAVVPAPRIGRHHQPLVVKHHRQRPARTTPHPTDLPHAA